MLYKKAFISAFFIVCLVLTGCSQQKLHDGDVIVPPVISDKASEDSRSTSLLNNMSNVGNAVKASSNMRYEFIDKINPPVAIFADNKYLYLLESKESTTDAQNKGVTGRYGDSIGIYDVDNGSLVRVIADERLGECTAFTVKDSNIYVYDFETGSVSLFSSSGGFLSAYDTGMAKVQADKIAVTDNQKIILKIGSDIGSGSRIFVYNTRDKKSSLYEKEFFSRNEKNTETDISDFCIYNQDSILVNVSNGQLSLLNIDKKILQKSCYFPKAVRFIIFDGNILYYTSEDIPSISPGNAANFSNIRLGSHIGRLLLNRNFKWPESEKEFEGGLLKSLQLTLADGKGRHYGTAYNSKYLFFLDFLSTVKEEDKNPASQFTLYRIIK